MCVGIVQIRSLDVKAGHQRPVSKMPSKWRFTGRRMAVPYCMLALHVGNLSLGESSVRLYR